MNLTERNIKELIRAAAESKGFLLIDTIIRGHGNNRVIEVYIDGENYVSAEDCSQVSREINERLKETDLQSENFRLDVSSPGVERPLKFLKQFPKHINRKFELSYKENNETKKTSATLLEVNNDELTFLSNNKNEFIVNFNNIIKARVLVSFS